jgi:thiol-disulfide isomerase/thioredoxin
VLAISTLALAFSFMPPVSTDAPVLNGVRAVDVEGKVHRVGFDERARPVVLVFLGTECPVSRRYAPRLSELAREANGRGIQFFGVISDASAAPAAAREFRGELELGFPVLYDAAGDLAERLRPERVPEAFVLDSAGKLAYRGRIDDRFAEPGKLRPRIDSEDLLAALEAVAKGTLPATPRTDVVGCVFESWSSAHAVTWARDVAPILYANCVECHRAGDVAPFALLEPADAQKRAMTIAEACASRFMPPWKAAAGHGTFREERRLGPRQIEALRAWAAAGAPAGELAEALPPPPLPASRWRLGEPDYLVELPVDYDVSAEGDDIYRYFAVPSTLTEDQDVVAVDFRPGDPSVVHHCLAYLDISGSARKMDEQDPGPGFSLFGKGSLQVKGDPDFVRLGPIAGWAPGNQPYTYPDGLAMELPGGVDFVLEVHYHKTGKATKDRSALAFYFADEPVERHVEGLVIGTEEIDIPAGEDAHGRYVYMELPAAIELIDVTPHMHYLGREVEAYATLPDGGQVPLIKIDDWDFRWQDSYVYREPVKLPKGARIEALFRFDNSAANPFNPSSPPRRVKEGWQTTDEMCLFYFTLVPAEPQTLDAIQSASIESFLRPSDP